MDIEQMEVVADERVAADAKATTAGSVNDRGLMKYKFWLAFDEQGKEEAKYLWELARDLKPESEKKAAIEGLLYGVQWMVQQGVRMKAQAEREAAHEDNVGG